MRRAPYALMLVSIILSLCHDPYAEAVQSALYGNRRPRAGAAKKKNNKGPRASARFPLSGTRAIKKKGEGREILAAALDSAMKLEDLKAIGEYLRYRRS